jgi:hypothetical protein
VTRRADFDGALQQDVLTRFRVKSGRNRTQVAAMIPMDHDTYRRYETGQTELRVSQVPAFARALLIEPSTLIEALDLLETESSNGWTFRAALAGKLPDDLIDQLADEWEGKPLLNQQAAARGILQLAERRGQWTPTMQATVR